MALIVAADTGGTFTDLAAYDTIEGRILYSKSLTTYDNLVDGVMACVRKAKVDLSQAEIIKFGTTLVINTFVQRNGARAAFVTTEGWRDILEMRRGNRPIAFDLRYNRAPVLIPRDRCFEVRERIAADGSVIRPLDRAALPSLAVALRALEVEAVAVSLFNSYVDPTHEHEVAEFLREALPGVYVTAGTELTREWYEFERSSTAAANAYVGPRLKAYLGDLDRALREDGFSKTFYLMASNGGVFSVERAERQPVLLVESGPVGGCIGAGVYGEALGLRHVIAFDMGGTTAKCAVVEGGRFEVRSPYYVGGTDYGFPIRGGVLDIVEVGAGGGSIARVDDQGRLSVGPQSAGSDPGPACYGRGGQEPTITDANLVLGRIGARSFLGSEMTLDEAAAEQSIRKLAAKLGLDEQSLDEMAQGVITLGTLTMASAVKQITIERGLDPRDFVMVAFGGGGPLHSATLARDLGIAEAIIPPEPGIFSALGMIMADARVDETHTFLRPLNAESVAEMIALFEQMEREANTALRAEIGQVNTQFERQAEMRFRGQRHTMKTPIGHASTPEAIRSIFEQTYRQRFGHVSKDAPVELVSLVLTTSAGLDRPGPVQLRPALPSSPPTTSNTRMVYFGERSARLPTPVLKRAELPIGFLGRGPAVIEEYGSTTVIGPDDAFLIGELGEIRIRFPRS